MSGNVTPTPLGLLVNRLHAAGLERLIDDGPHIAPHWQVLVAMAALFDAEPASGGAACDDQR